MATDHLEMAPFVGPPAPDAAGVSTVSRGASTSTGHVVLNIDALVKSIDQRILLVEENKPANLSNITISKVDDCADGEDEYTPHYVPIGPYHRGCLPSQQKTDAEKLRILNGVLNEMGAQEDETGAQEDEMGEQEEGAKKKLVNLRGLLEEIGEQEEDARACYADRFGKMEGNEFVQMLLFDGCYLLVCFVDNTVLKRVAAVAAAAPAMDESRVRDSFYLLENQIPFSVLERIYVKVSGNDEGNVLSKLTVYVQTLLRERLYIGEPPVNIARPDHLLHLVHQHFTLRNGTNAQPTQRNDGTNNQPTQRNDGTGRWRRATEYCSQANVRFERRVISDKSTWRSVLDVELDSGTLRMPRLRVDINTWTILRNLMALEQLPRHLKKPYVTAYCLFMSQVACTAEDVELLGSAGVVEHFLGSDAEAAEGFANLCNGVALEFDDLSSNYLKPTWHNLESRCSSRMHNLAGWFQQKHCRNNYYFAAFVVAVIFFVCAVLQAVYAVLGHGK